MIWRVRWSMSGRAFFLYLSETADSPPPHCLVQRHWSRSRAAGSGLPPYARPELSFQRLDDLEIVGQLGREQIVVQWRLELGVGELVAHAGTVGEGQFSGAQAKVVGGKGDFDGGDQTAGGGAPGLQHQFANVVRRGLRKYFETAFEFRPAARETCFEQRQRLLPFSHRFAGERVPLGAFELRINHQHLRRLPHGNGFWRRANLPAEAVRRGEPDASARDERLGQRFEVAGLGNLGRPGLDVRLRVEPGGEQGLGRRRLGLRKKQTENREGQTRCSHGATRINRLAGQPEAQTLPHAHGPARGASGRTYLGQIGTKWYHWLR